MAFFNVTFDAIEKIPTKLKEGCWKDGERMLKGSGKVTGRLGKG
jgi:hypothetical protein